MITLLKEILNNMTIDGWHIDERKIHAKELFYIRQDIDMSRSKDVHNFEVTLYKDFEEEGTKYKGSSVTKIAPTMSKEEITEAFDDAAYAATFVKNPFYPLLDGQKEDHIQMTSALDEKALEAWLPDFTEALFKSDIPSANALNSAELFLNKNFIHILNSKGLDVSYENYSINLEFITNWSGEKEEVELYKDMNFSDYAPELIVEEVASMIAFCKERAEATPTPALNDFNVLLTGEPVKTFFNYHIAQSNVRSVYEQISTFKIDDKIQGDDIVGDKLNITLDPTLKNSTFSKPYDLDGLKLIKTKIIEDGILKHYWGNSRFSHYMSIEPIGNIRNLVVDPGSKSIEEMKAQPYLELVEFSDFQMDQLTGDFAGEIRLGRYFDGTTLKPVTSGSLSGNIKDVQKEFYLSKETHQENNYLGPKTLQLKVNIAGN